MLLDGGCTYVLSAIDIYIVKLNLALRPDDIPKMD